MDLSKFTNNGKFLMLAFDHRGSFKKLMNPSNPDLVTDQQAIDLKREIIHVLEPQFSALLIDQETGLPAYAEHIKPFLLPIEKSGYTDKLGERITEIEFSVEDLIKDGASGVKILLYFNPNVESAKVQLHTAKRVLQECKQKDVPLFLEIRVYDPQTGDDVDGKLNDLVIGSLAMFIQNDIRPHVWKLEYPGTHGACEEVTNMIGNTPWILLTKGASFEDFADELKIAKHAGCSGFLAGRAVWQEVAGMQGVERERFLKETLPNRFKEICDIVLET